MHRFLDSFKANPGGPGVDRYGRVLVPALETFSLPAGRVMIYFEQSWDQRYPFVPENQQFWPPHDLFLSITDTEGGGEMPIRFPPGTELGSNFLRSAASKYVRFSGHSFRRPGLARVFVGLVEIARAGRYQVEADAEYPYGPQAHVTLGE